MSPGPLHLVLLPFIMPVLLPLPLPLYLLFPLDQLVQGKRLTLPLPML